MYQVIWDNGHSAGTLAGEYRTKREAENAARDWKRDMVAADDDPAAARRAYSWEIVAAPPIQLRPGPGRAGG